MAIEPLRCILFDLDGTLLDTAPDLIACLNEALQQHGYLPSNTETIKPLVSFGALAMIKGATLNLSDNEQNEILNTMLLQYENNIARYTVFFKGIEQVLRFIEEKGLLWGIVTNKRQRFTTPLLNTLDLNKRIACVISGDSAAHAKPHVAPMLLACKTANVKASECVYIGDAPHDIVAGRQAGMRTLAAVYGYLKSDDEPEKWGATALINSPDDILTWLMAELK